MTDRKEAFEAVADKLPGVWGMAGTIPLMDQLVDIWEAGQAKAAPVAAETTAGFDAAVIDHLRREEGVRPKAYKDHLGYWTIGVGRLIDPRKGGRITPEEDAILLANDPSRKGKAWTEYVLTDAEINMLLRNDVARFVAAMKDWPSWRKVQGNTARMVALLSMCFQLGPVGLAGFKNSLKMVTEGRFGEAADNFMLSKWAKQTPSRAERITGMIRTGKLA